MLYGYDIQYIFVSLQFNCCSCGVIFSHSDGNFSHSRIQLRLSASPAIVRVALERCRQYLSHLGKISDVSEMTYQKLLFRVGGLHRTSRRFRGSERLKQW